MKKAGCLMLATATLLLLAVLPAHAKEGRGHSRGGGQRFHHSGFQHHQRHHPSFHQHHRFHHHRQFHHGPHFGARFFVGPGWWWGSAYPVYRVPVVIQQSPLVYIQQEATPEPYYWYYCQSAQAYYPYAQQCPGGWLKVVPPATESVPD